MKSSNGKNHRKNFKSKNKKKKMGKERAFFNDLLGKWVRVDLISTEGSINGILKWVDQFTILVEMHAGLNYSHSVNPVSKLIYKHDISMLWDITSEAVQGTSV
jgi:sRNA-binding regulator protein Hfq